MDPKQKPQAAPVKLIKARVRPHNKYGSHSAGDVLDVEEKELRLVPWCLIALDEERKQAEEAKRSPSSGDQAREELEGYRQMYRAQHDAMKKHEAARMGREAAERELTAKKLLGEE